MIINMLLNQFAIFRVTKYGEVHKVTNDAYKFKRQ
jgi:hypothetical protein